MISELPYSQSLHTRSQSSLDQYPTLTPQDSVEEVAGNGLSRLPQSQSFERLPSFKEFVDFGNINLPDTTSLNGEHQQYHQDTTSQDDRDDQETQLYHLSAVAPTQKEPKPPPQQFHTTYDTPEEPFESLQLLGHGSFGSVDEVVSRQDTTRTCYARKRFILPPRNREKRSKEIAEEARIVRRLRHRHIVKVLGTYSWRNQFGIIMSPVAETDLNNFLQHVDSLESYPEEERLECYNIMLSWPACLLRALDYTHEMLVKHRDIKPSNILIKDGTIYLTDFGIAKELVEGATTGSTALPGPFTPAYSAPELFADSARRGRAVDIYALGCVFLEIALVLHDYHGVLESFSLRRLQASGTRNYAQNEPEVLLAIWDCWKDRWNHDSTYDGRHLDRLNVAEELLLLVFLMMDPDPSQRITCRQLAALLAHPTHGFPHISTAACGDCKVRKTYEDSNIPLHSIFTTGAPVKPHPLEVHNLTYDTPSTWEVAKRQALVHHIWWD